MRENLDEEDLKILSKVSSLIISELRNFSKKLSDTPLGELVTDFELKKIQDFMLDLSNITEKASDIRSMMHVHFILMDIIVALMVSPTSLKGLSKLTCEYVNPIVHKKALKKLDRILKKNFSNFKMDNFEFKEKMDESNQLNLFDEDGKRMTVEEVMKL